MGFLDQILELEVTKCERKLQANDLKGFKILESLILPKNINILPAETFEDGYSPNLMELSCSVLLLENITADQRKFLKTIHFPYENEIRKDVVNYLHNIYDIKVDYGTEVPDIKRSQSQDQNSMKQSAFGTTAKTQSRVFVK